MFLDIEIVSYIYNDNIINNINDNDIVIICTSKNKIFILLLFCHLRVPSRDGIVCPMLTKKIKLVLFQDQFLFLSGTGQEQFQGDASIKISRSY